MKRTGHVLTHWPVSSLRAVASHDLFSMVITVPDLAPGQFDIDGSDCKYCYMLTLETVGFLELIFQTE